MASYTISEPQPHFEAGSYSHTGIGGAGNIFRVTKETQRASLIPQNRAPSKGSSSRFYSGRGGAGNAHRSTPKPVMSLDEEYDRAVAQDNATVGHVGRGGAGNVFGASSSRSIKSSASSAGGDESRRTSAADDNHSLRSGFWARLSGISVGSHH